MSNRVKTRMETRAFRKRKREELEKKNCSLVDEEHTNKKEPCLTLGCESNEESLTYPSDHSGGVSDTHKCSEDEFIYKFDPEMFPDGPPKKDTKSEGVCDDENPDNTPPDGEDTPRNDESTPKCSKDESLVEFFPKERNLMDKHILRLIKKKKRRLVHKVIFIAFVLFIFYLFLHYGPVDNFFKREIPHKLNRTLARGILIVVIAIILFVLI